MSYINIEFMFMNNSAVLILDMQLILLFFLNYCLTTIIYIEIEKIPPTEAEKYILQEFFYSFT